MKIMKKFILLFLIACNCLICSSANISKDLLTAYSWTVVTPNFHGHQIHILNFDKNNMLRWDVKFITTNVSGAVSHLYYLTDQEPSSFDLTKVGKATSGRYIVVVNKKHLGKKDCPFFYYEVISYDGNIIELKREFGETWKIKKNKK